MPRYLLDARTIQDHFPGIGRYLYNLLDALAPQIDGEIVVIVNRALRNTRFDLDALTRHPNLRLHPTDIPTFHWREQIDLPRLMRSLRPDVVHLPYNVRPYRLSLPNILTLFDAIPRRYPAYFPLRTRWTVEILQRLAIRSADAFVAISQATAQDFQTLYHIPASRITITPLAADPIFRPQPPEIIAALRQRLDLPDHYLLYVGSNKPHKNLHRLLDAWSQVQRSEARDQRSAHSAPNLQPAIRNPQLLIATSWDPASPDPTQRVQELGLSNTVRFLPNFPSADLPALYAGADLFVFPSLYEGFGLPVIEAMACGAPVACSNTSSLPEVAGDAALLFDPTDVGALAAALSRALNDAALRDDLRQRGLAQAARFSWERTAQATLSAYRNEVISYR